MLTNLMKLLRLVLAVLVLGVGAAPVAEAASRAAATPRVVETRPSKPKGDADEGVLWIAAAVALFVFMAWIAVRMGDHARPADKIPG